MKCKKLFAILLSLCLIASAFVAVSAQEQYESTARIFASAGSDFDAEDLEVVGKYKLPTGVTMEYVNDPRPNHTGRVLKLTAKGITSSTSTNLILGFALKDTNGNTIRTALNGKTVKATMDYMVEYTGSSTPIDNVNSGLWVRNLSWSPNGAAANFKSPHLNIKQMPATIVSGAWDNLSYLNSKTTTFTAIPETDAESYCYHLYFRPNIKGDCVMYIDDMFITVTETLTNAEWVTPASPMLTATAAKNGENVKMTLANNSESKVKLSGTLFIAEYNGDQLVQFGSANLSETTIAVGANTSVTASFANEPAAGNTVKAFLWDTATLAPHYFAPNVQ